MPIQHPIVIVGGGPIGLELAVALRRRRIPLEVLEAGTLGNTIAWWAPQTRWFSSNERIQIAGVPLITIDQGKCSREQYLAYLRSIAKQFDIKVRCQTTVIDIRPEEDCFQVRTKSLVGTNALLASLVILAIGGTDFPRRLEIPGIDLPHVDGYLREVHRYFGRRVVVVGGRNSAIEAALRLHHGGAAVALVYRGETLPTESIKYWLLPEINGLIATGRIQAFFASQPVNISAQSVTIRHHQGSEVELPADDVLTLVGYQQDKSLLRRIGVELTGEMQRPVYDETTMETNLPGIFVAGTAVAGTQSSSYKTFLENCHVHVDRIVNAIAHRYDIGASQEDKMVRSMDGSWDCLMKINPES
jgi:thioredoxin reductase (NADPH)